MAEVAFDPTPAGVAGPAPSAVATRTCEPAELVAMTGAWREAGAAGDLNPLLDGLEWLLQHWPEPSSYEARLTATIARDLRRLEARYAQGELPPDEGLESLSSVLEVGDVLWESRSVLPPAAAERVGRAARVALAQGRIGEPGPAVELLDLLLAHWLRWSGEESPDVSGDDAGEVRLMLLDVAAFWSGVTDEDPPDVTGLAALIARMEALLAERASHAARAAEELDAELTALLGRWRLRRPGRVPEPRRSSELKR